MTELEEVGRTADAIRADLETVFVRGTATSTPNERRSLVVRTEEWERIGAHHVASRLRAALKAADADAKDAPYKFLSAYTSLHAFERVLSLQVARDAWAGYLSTSAEAEADHDSEADDPAPASIAEPPTMTLEDPKGAAQLTNELAKVVEDLVRTGLTSATAATRTKLDAAFKEASRRKLLRLGASLRYTNEEVGRFLADDGSFTARRYGLFLHRPCLLAKGTSFAIAKNDGRLVASLSAGTAAAPKPIGGAIEVVTIGVHKRVTATVCSFDFRLRVTKSPKAGLQGKSLVFSLVFARKVAVPAEAYLHLPQPQKFAPKIFRDKTTITITDAAVIPDERGGGRLVLGAKSVVTAGKGNVTWEDHYGWDPEGAAARARAHAPTPLDLAVELQEEIVLDEWQLAPGGDGTSWVHAAGLAMRVGMPAGEEGAELTKRLEARAKKKNKPRLYGTMHYEYGQLVFTPLSYLGDDGPEYLMLSDENINLSALLGSLNL